MNEDTRYREKLLREDRSTLRAEYLSERQQVTKDRYAAAQDFDKAMLTLSASALAFSMALLKFIGKTTMAVELLHISWVMFALTVIATVAALFASYHAFDQEVQNVDREYRTNDRRYLTAYGVAEDLCSFHDESAQDLSRLSKITSPIKRRLARIIEVANIVAMLLFIVGMVSLVVFGKLNLDVKETEMPEDRNSDSSAPSVQTQLSTETASASPTGRPVRPTIVAPLDQVVPIVIDPAPAQPGPAPGGTDGESGGE